MPFKDVPPLYSTWQGMRRRCLNQNFKQWADYGGRGIKICEAWSSYAVFERDMSPRPPGASIERINPNGDYEPSNCRWATPKEQMRNQRRTHYVVIEGMRYKAIELSGMCGLKTDTIVSRAKRGMTYEQVIAHTRYITQVGWKFAIEKRVANQLAKTHCKQGHAWSQENTYITKEGWRNCRECHRLKENRKNAAKRMAASSP